VTAPDRALRLLYVTRQLPPRARGGIGSYVMALAAMMRDAGHTVTVLSAAPGQVRSTEQLDGITIERFPGVGPQRLWRRLLGGGRLSVARLHGALSAWWALRRLPGDFDVIEAPEWKAEGLLLPRRRRGSLVVHLHLAHEVVRSWDAEAGPPRSRVGELLERATARRALARTATSHLSSTLPGARPWLPHREVVVVPPPLDAERWAGTRPVDATDPVVLFVGHLERRKAPEVLLSALGLLAGEVAGLRAVFVGRPLRHASGRRYDDHLRAEASRLGVDIEVRPPSADPREMRELYDAARAVVVSSRFETLSMVAMEAAAAGRPVVMTSSVGAVEWLGDAVPSVVVAPDDEVALAAALRPLLLDPGEALRCAALLRQRALEVCAPRAIVESRLAVYRATASRLRDRLEPVPC
jgi:glycogen synthase